MFSLRNFVFLGLAALASCIFRSPEKTRKTTDARNANNYGLQRPPQAFGPTRPFSTPTFLPTSSDPIFNELASYRKDSAGCIRGPEEWQAVDRNPTLPQEYAKLCRAEMAAVDLANAYRRKKCPNDLIYNHQLAYVSRLNAVRQSTSGGPNGNVHLAWETGLVQTWFKTQFPIAASLLRFERENFAAFGGSDAKTYSPEQLANEFTSMWLNSSGHLAPIIDCANTHAGVGIYNYSSSMDNWLAYMAFGERR